MLSRHRSAALPAFLALALVVPGPAFLSAQRVPLSKGGTPGPINVTVVGGAKSALVSWTPVAGRGVTYRVLRGLDARAPGVDLTAPIVAATFEDTKAAAGATYFYQVVAVYADGATGAAAPVAFTFAGAAIAPSGIGRPIGVAPAPSGGKTPYAPPPVPSPSSLTATIVGAHAVGLTWTPVQGVTSYRVFGPGLPVAGVVANAQPFRVTNVPTGQGMYTISTEYPGATNVPGLAKSEIGMQPFYGAKASIVYTRNTGGVMFDFDVATAEPLSFRLWRDNGQGGALTEITTGVSWNPSPTSDPGITHITGLMSAQDLYPTLTYRYQVGAVVANGSFHPTAFLPVSMPAFNVRSTILVAPDRIVVEWNPFGWNPSGMVQYTIEKGTVTATGLTMDWILDAAGNRLVVTGPLKYEDTIVQRGVTYFYNICAPVQYGHACPGVQATIAAP